MAASISVTPAKKANASAKMLRITFSLMRYCLLTGTGLPGLRTKFASWKKSASHRPGTPFRGGRRQIENLNL
jgi:hypothetical protein